MKIGIELRQTTLGIAGGIAQLFKGVLEALFALHPDHEFVLFCTVYNRSLLQSVPDHVKVLTLPTSRFFADIDRIASEEGIEVFFRSYPVEDDDLTFPLARQVFFIPDIQHEFFPEFFSLKALRTRRVAFNWALSRAGAIGTLTEYTRQTLRDYEWTRCQDIFLMSPALPVEHQHASPIDLSPEEQALIPPGDFFLYPANLWPHKNHRRVLRAFELFLKQTGRPMSFVLTGHPDGWSERQAEFPDLPVRHLGFVRPQLLRLLFERTKALVFFSLYEGFGIPLLEAFNAGTPVICSNTTSLPEVGGDAVLTCDPTDVQAMSDLMAQIVQDGALRADLVAKGKKRLPLYSWEQSAQNLFEACQRAARAANPDTTPILLTSTTDNLPLVSIVTPSYNQGQFLKRTIESVLNQTYPNIEYIVIDGGSTDGSADTLRSYGDRFEWISEPDRGQADAINKGFARSRGEIRAYLNSDDVLLPDAVEKAVAHFQQHPDCDLVYGRAYYIDEQDQITGMYNTAAYSFGRLMKDCCICQPAAFWRTRIAKKIDPFNDRLNYALDYEYWLRIDRAGGRIEHIYDALASSRLYPETKTLSARRQFYREIFQVCQAQGGYVHLSYSVGLWHHLIWEREDGWPRLLRWLPKSYRIIGYLYHKWYRLRHNPPQENLIYLGRSIKRRVFDRSPVLERLAQPILYWVYRISGRKPVYGFWPDNNWLGPACRIFLKNRTPGQELRLAGIAPVDMKLTIKTQGKVIGVYPLRAGQCETISFNVETESDQQLLLRFSRHIVDPAKRRLSFLLMETNLFSEQDVLRRIGMSPTQAPKVSNQRGVPLRSPEVTHGGSRIDC